MARTVITVSRTMGAGGEDLADTLASELGYRYVDSEIIHAAAEQAGCSLSGKNAPDRVADAREDGG